MSRRSAIIVALIAAAVFAVVYFWPEDTGAQPLASPSVASRLHLGDGAVQRGAVAGDVVRPRRGDRWHGDRRRNGRHDAWRRGPRPLVIVTEGERVIERETVIVQPAPPVPAAIPAAPPEPLDPHGQARTVSARGADRPREWVLGGVLPPELPLVSLNAAAYGLPPLPSGQFYARVDGDVLRVEAGTRRVIGVTAQ